MSVFLRAKFEFSIVILRSFRQGVGGRVVIYPHPTSKQTPKKPTQIRVKKNKTTSTSKVKELQNWHWRTKNLYLKRSNFS